MTQEGKEPIDNILYAAACGIKNTSTMTEEEKDMKACEIAIRNSYLRCLYSDRQLAYVFFLGMKYGNNGELPKGLLDDEEFVNKID